MISKLKLVIGIFINVWQRLSIRGEESLQFLYVSLKLVFKQNDNLYDIKHKLNLRFIRRIPVRVTDTDVASVTDYKIWTLWWQGENEMPEIIKMTYNSIIKYSNRDVVLITKDNYSDYVTLPVFLEERVKRKEIGLAHLSDYIRIALLCKYGGLWLDSTVLCTREVPSWIYEQEFFTVKSGVYDHRYLPMGRWNMQVIGSNNVNCPVFVYMKQFLEEYWKKYDRDIDYLFFDYGMHVMCETNRVCKELVDKVPVTNEDMHWLRDKADEPYENVASEWKLKKANTWFFKLTYKHEFACSVAGKRTLYNEIITDGKSN